MSFLGLPVNLTRVKRKVAAPLLNIKDKVEEVQSVGKLVERILTPKPTIEEYRRGVEKNQRSYHDNAVKVAPKPSVEEASRQAEAAQRRYAASHVRVSDKPTPKQRSYITSGDLGFVELTNYGRLDIQFQSNVEVTRKHNVANLKVVGRNTPVLQPVGGGYHDEP